MNKNNCKECGRELTFDETALHKKLIDRFADEFLCIDCCAKHFKVRKQTLEKKIIEFKEWGCTLFTEN